MKENRPKLEIAKQPLDWYLETLGGVAVLIMIFITIYYYPGLPKEIPSHFGVDGKPDAYGSKVLILIMPILGLILYLGLSFMNRFPHTFNYTVTITKENAERQYKIATRMIRSLNVFIVCLFAYITYVMIQNGLGNSMGLGAYFTPVILLGTFGLIGYFIWKSFKEV